MISGYLKETQDAFDITFQLGNRRRIDEDFLAALELLICSHTSGLQVPLCCVDLAHKFGISIVAVVECHDPESQSPN